MRISRRLALALVLGVLSAAGAVDAKHGECFENRLVVGRRQVGTQSDSRDVFLDALTDLGYVEGETVVLERRDAARR